MYLKIAVHDIAIEKQGQGEAKHVKKTKQNKPDAEIPFSKTCLLNRFVITDNFYIN